MNPSDLILGLIALVFWGPVMAGFWVWLATLPLSPFVDGFLTFLFIVWIFSWGVILVEIN